MLSKIGLYCQKKLQNFTIKTETERVFFYHINQLLIQGDILTNFLL